MPCGSEHITDHKHRMETGKAVLGGQGKDQKNQEGRQDLASVFGHRKIARCKKWLVFPKGKITVLVLINIIIKRPTPNVACTCLCVSLYPCQRGILAFQGSHGNLLQKTSLRCWAARDYGLNDPKAEMFNLPSCFDGFLLFFLAMAIGTLFLTVQFSFLFPEYPFCSRNYVCIRNKKINMT